MNKVKDCSEYQNARAPLTAGRLAAISRPMASTGLVHMANGIAQQEYRCRTDGGSLERQIAPEREAGRNTDREVSHPNLELERARLPADMGRGNSREKDMGHAGPEARHPDRKQQYPGKDALGYRSTAACCGDHERPYKEHGGQITENEADCLAYTSLGTPYGSR